MTISLYNMIQLSNVPVALIAAPAPVNIVPAGIREGDKEERTYQYSSS
jgi:hypothetical protein